MKKTKFKNKLLMTIGALALAFSGSVVALAASGFFENSKIVENNITILADLAKGHKQKSEELQGKLNQNSNEQKGLKDQIEKLKNDLQKEKDGKQAELDRKQQEVDKKQHEADMLRQQIDSLKSDNQRKDQEMQRLADFSTQKVNEAK